MLCARTHTAILLARKHPFVLSPSTGILSTHLATLATKAAPQSSPTSSDKFRPASSTTKAAASSRIEQVSSHLTSQSRSNSTMTSAPTSRGGFTTRKIGAPNTLEHRIYVEKDGVPVSPFHDIPLYANEQQTVLNMVVEIPRWTNAKQEVGVAATAAI